MSDYEFTLALCVIGMGYAVLFGGWMLSSSSKAAQRCLRLVDKINDLLTFGKR